MRQFLSLWILFGLLTLITIPSRAEFNIEKISMMLDSTEGEAIENDLCCFSNWQFKNFRLELTNKFSWPEHNENYSKFNVKARLEEYEQLKLDLDYQWNQRYRIFSPELNYLLELSPDLTIGLEYGIETRNPIIDKDYKLKSCLEIGTLKMELDKDSWSYGLRYAQSGKEYPSDRIKNYTKKQLNQELAWRIVPNFKVNLSYAEATRYFPYDIDQDYWGSAAGIGGEYRFNERWQLTGTIGGKEDERGLAPYLEQRDLKIKLTNRRTKDLTFNLQAGSAQFDYSSERAYIDPDEISSEDEDLKSRIEKKVGLECNSRLKSLKLTVEGGLFWASKDYRSTLVEDLIREGLYASLRWNPGKIGVELEMAPDGNLWRVNGFYQLKLEYSF